MRIVQDERGYLRQDPLPTPSEQHDYYLDRYYQADHKDQYAKEKREWWYWQKEYNRRLTRFGWLGSSAGWLLDYGAGYGWFAKAAKKAGRDVRSYDASRAAQGHIVRQGLHTAIGIEAGHWAGRFQGVHCSLVLEHVINPLDLLCRLRKALVRRGTICIVVPNEFNPLQKELTRRFGYTPYHREHLNYFTQDSIQKLMMMAGFTIVMRESTFPMEWFPLRTPLNYIKHPRLGGVAHMARMLYETILPASITSMNRSDWASDGIGRETVVWGKAY